MTMYTLYTDHVLRDDGACIPFDESNRDYQDYLAWVSDGNTPTQPPAPTFADYQAAFMGNFSQWLEDTAHTNSYDSVLSCCTYATSAVTQFKNDALAMIAWRDALWTWAAQWQAGFNGQLPNPIPTWESVKALAPQPATYGWIVHQPGNIVDLAATGGTA